MSESGGLGAEVLVTVSDDDGEMLRAMWEQVERTPPGPKRSGLIVELRTHMDLFACFPGIHAEVPVSDADASTPPYLLHDTYTEPVVESEPPTAPVGEPALF